MNPTRINLCLHTILFSCVLFVSVGCTGARMIISVRNIETKNPISSIAILSKSSGIIRNGHYTNTNGKVDLFTHKASSYTVLILLPDQTYETTPIEFRQNLQWEKLKPIAPNIEKSHNYEVNIHWIDQFEQDKD